MAKKPKRTSRTAAARSRRPIAARAQDGAARRRSSRSTSIAASSSCCTRRGCSTTASSTTGSRCSRADAWYWVPSEPDQANPHDTVSLIYDDRRLLETRVRRLASPRMYSQEPRSRTSRIVANVTIEDDRGQFLHRALQIHDDRISPRAAAHVRRHRAASPGAADGRIMIAWKRVDLVNCDAPMDGITMPF